MDAIRSKVDSLENTVPLLPAQSQVEGESISKLQTALTNLEKRVTSMVGASHKGSIQVLGGNSIQNLCNKVEGHRKRLKDVEELRGSSKLVV